MNAEQSRSDETAEVGGTSAEASSGDRSALRNRIRPLPPETDEDTFLPFLDLCFNWSMDRARIELTDLADREDTAFYYKGWGRRGDIAVAARADSDPESEIIGLAWLRLADITAVIDNTVIDDGTSTSAAGADGPSTNTRGPRGPFTGYGWVAEDIPELSIAVLPDHQSQGIGGALLDVLCTLARMSGFPAVSLSVEDGNGAAQLYHARGFVTVGRSGNSDILVRRLTLD